MSTKVQSFSVAVLLLFCSIFAQAQVTVNTDTTTDDNQGVEFLHVGQTSAMTFAEAQAGISYGGFTWRLATVDEFLMLVEGATGVAIPDWDGSNLGDVGFSPTEAVAMMDALGGTGTSQLPGFWVDGESFGDAQVYAHTGNDDFHLQDGVAWGSTVPALMVRGGSVVPRDDITAVPTLPQWALIMLAMLMLGLASATLYRRA